VISQKVLHHIKFDHFCIFKLFTFQGGEGVTVFLKKFLPTSAHGKKSQVIDKLLLLRCSSFGMNFADILLMPKYLDKIPLHYQREFPCSLATFLMFVLQSALTTLCTFAITSLFLLSEVCPCNPSLPATDP
jgi:hypothetical protein